MLGSSEASGQDCSSGGRLRYEEGWVIGGETMEAWCCGLGHPMVGRKHITLKCMGPQGSSLGHQILPCCTGH